MFEKLVEILKSYGLSVRYNDGTIYACKDIGKDALVFDILKFNDTFYRFISIVDVYNQR